MRSSWTCLLVMGLIALMSACGPRRPDLPPEQVESLYPVVEQQAALSAPGAPRLGDYLAGAAKGDGDHADYFVTLDASHCYVFSGVGGRGVKRLYLYLWNPKDSRVATEKPERSMATLRHCPESSGSYHLQAKVDEGDGVFAVGVYTTDGDGRIPADPRAAIIAQANQVAAGAALVGDMFHGTGDRTDWAVALSAGRCYWFIGAGAPGVRQLYLYLWDPSNKRITESRTPNAYAVVGHCPTITGMHKVQAKVHRGSGDYLLGVYEK